MWMSKPTKTAFFSLIISSFLVGVTSCPHFLHSQRKSLELDLGKINNNFTGGIIAVYWDLGLTANTVLRATLAVVLRTKCETQWNYHYVTRPDGVRANRSDNREGQCIWWCHGMSGSKVAFKWRTVFFCGLLKISILHTETISSNIQQTIPSTGTQGMGLTCIVRWTWTQVINYLTPCVLSPDHCPHQGWVSSDSGEFQYSYPWYYG